jgi:hypothetical protein
MPFELSLLRYEYDPITVLLSFNVDLVPSTFYKKREHAGTAKTLEEGGASS